ncbi:hypothetical protein CA85_13210 [Allorhodopirellula solitaria]|uniref:Uncharacterized protein n=1 Tax=Allorhodopirellula solitaria TaxID=2527987 RepID=A0A5C5YBV1_9BACT|nr:hypothetical protein CA85_13210 [Allorhodopirellula solitaria]
MRTLDVGTTDACGRWEPALLGSNVRGAGSYRPNSMRTLDVGTTDACGRWEPALLGSNVRRAGSYRPYTMRALEVRITDACGRWEPALLAVEECVGGEQGYEQRVHASTALLIDAVRVLEQGTVVESFIAAHPKSERVTDEDLLGSFALS